MAQWLHEDLSERGERRSIRVVSRKASASPATGSSKKHAAQQAELIDWHQPFDRVCNDDNPPFVQWFEGGQTNLCHNAVDRHLKDRAQQAALIAVSSETGLEKTYSFNDLHREVQRMAASLKALGVAKGDRVLIYMPMIAEAAFAMLACARIGAIHCVVFGGFASGSLASRIEDATPKVAGRDHLWNDLRETYFDAQIACEWLDATAISYTIYTSGTTGKPKGVQRDTGGYTVALAASMKHIFGGRAGETFFCTSDIGWVVGHSYIVYGPLIAGMATLMYEGLPTQGMDKKPNGGIWWELVEKYQVNVMFSAPTAVRVLKKQDPALLAQYDLSSLRALFLAGEPLDEPTARWISEALKVPIIDNYWQTESGWPILAIANGVEQKPSKFGSPGVPMYGFNVKLVHEATGEELTVPGEKGVVVLEGPTPPGFMQTLWKDDERFVNTYWKSIPGRQVYSTFDWGIRDADGYYFILGRTDDVINVAGHRLGTREIEESISGHAQVAEVAVVGVADGLKGQVAMAFAVLKNASILPGSPEAMAIEAEIMKRVDSDLGAVARPARVRFVSTLPKTRSGKLLRRAIQAVCEGRDAGDLTTMDDPAALEQIRDRLQAK